MARSGNLLVLAVLVLASLRSAHGAVVKVCNGNLTYAGCSNCCALKKGCVYLQPGSGQATCIGGDSRACTRECQAPKLLVCPASSSGGLARSDIEVVRGKLPPSQPGCAYYNIDNGDYVPKLEELSTDQELTKRKKCKLDSIVEVCNANVSKHNCGCCGGQSGCLYLENAFSNRTCVPTEGPPGICPFICLPTVAVCSISEVFQGTTLESCTNARHSCGDMKKGCSLYNRTTGVDLCAKSSPSPAEGMALPL